MFWDVYGEHGHPLRLTMADFGPIMLARLLNLNETQTGVLQVLFKVADENGWLLLDLKSGNHVVVAMGHFTMWLQILLLAAEDPSRDIAMYINSPGGVVTAGLAMAGTVSPV